MSENTESWWLIMCVTWLFVTYGVTGGHDRKDPSLGPRQITTKLCLISLADYCNHEPPAIFDNWDFPHFFDMYRKSSMSSTYFVWKVFELVQYPSRYGWKRGGVKLPYKNLGTGCGRLAATICEPPATIFIVGLFSFRDSFPNIHFAEATQNISIYILNTRKW